MSEWKEYHQERLIKRHANGFCVIVPRIRESPIPISCPVCDMLLQTSDDAEYFRTKLCCRSCGLKWADPNLETWKKGWRPDEREVLAEVSRRQSMPVYLNLESLLGS